MAELIIHSGVHQGKRLILPERELLVGRDDECQMKLTSNLVSRRHCTLNVTPEGIWVIDLKSQNGTYVNDVAVIEPQLLQPGDILRIGAALFQVPPLPKTKPHRSDLEKISDADIADWLSDEESGSGPQGGDTAVIQGRTPKPTTEAPVAVPDHSVSGDSTVKTKSAVATTPVPSAVKRPVVNAKAPPKTVKEEAEDIIRQHWESVRAKRDQ